MGSILGEWWLCTGDASRMSSRSFCRLTDRLLNRAVMITIHKIDENNNRITKSSREPYTNHSAYRPQAAP